MKKNAPLFIYDCDGTLELPLIFAYAQEKQNNKNMTMSLAEFKAAHPDEKKLMISGMGDLIKYTACIGNNVLLSGGDPVKEGSKELQSLFPYFQNWKHNGEDVPFGKEPSNLLKNNPKVAQSLIEYFKPSKVIVIGDSVTECELAKNIKADILLIRGASEDLYQGLDSVPNKHTAQSGTEMKNLIRKDLERPKRRRPRSVSRPRRPYFYPKTHSRFKHKNGERV